MFYRNLGGAEMWGQQVKIVSPHPVIGSAYGWTVALSGDHAIVGAESMDVGIVPAAGAAYHHSRNVAGGLPDQWGYSSTLTEQSPGFIDEFGNSISVVDQFAAVGAENAVNGVGSVVLFQRSSDGSHWTAIVTIVDTPPVYGDLFGCVVSVDSNRCVIGSAGWNTYQGRAYSVPLVALSSPSPGKTFPLWLFLVIIAATAVLIGSASIGVFVLSRSWKSSSSSSSDVIGRSRSTSHTLTPLPEGLLEFSPRSDMEFIDMHSMSAHRQNPETASIKSGSSSGSALSSDSALST